ncbi:hypothetical protein DL770_010156 [Monosporascus sp. CRB-9-2]|nr:hypothetical protein DL770_010156 [Monosporascus sp. CRB-9-2]
MDSQPRPPRQAWILRDPQCQQHKYGLVQMRGNVNPPEIGKIFGDDGFEIPGTHIYIFAPRPRIDTWEIRDNYGKLLGYTDRNGNHLGDEVRRAEDANSGAGLKFPQYIDRIRVCSGYPLGTHPWVVLAIV